MKPSELKTELVARLNAVPTFAPYLPILIADGAADLMNDIQAALDANGFSIAVSLLSDAKPTSSGSGSVSGWCDYVVFCCDRGVSIPLTREVVMENIITAVSAPTARGEYLFEWQDMGDVSETFGLPATAHQIRAFFTL